MNMTRLKPGDVIECKVRGYYFIARYEGIEPDEYMGERVRITQLHPDGTDHPQPTRSPTFYRIAKKEARRKLAPKRVATWEIPGGLDARKAYMPRTFRRGGLVA